MSRHRTLAWGLAGLSGACGSAQRDGIPKAHYGPDDTLRAEPGCVAPRVSALGRVVGLLTPRQVPAPLPSHETLVILQQTSEPEWSLSVESAGVVHRLCPDQGICRRHQERPAVRSSVSAQACTAFAVSRRAVLTAGHCNVGRDSTLEWYVVFDYDHSPPDLGPSLSVSEVYAVDREYELDAAVSCDDSGSACDLSLLVLKECLPPEHSVLEISSAPARDEDGVATLGHPLGMPLTSSPSAVVFGAGEDMFSHTSDTLGGSSGSPVFDVAGGVVGLHVVGGGARFRGPCRVPKVCASPSDPGCGHNRAIQLAPKKPAIAEALSRIDEELPCDESLSEGRQ